MVTLVHFNEDQIANFSTNKAVENFEVINVEERLKGVFLCGTEVFVITKREMKVLSIMTPEEFLMHCRPEDTYTFMKNYGERETIVFYYSIVSKNREYNKLEHLYNKNEVVRVPSFYSFVIRLTADIWDKEICQDFFVKSEKAAKRIKNVRSKLRLKEKFVDDLLETLAFLRIYFEYGLTLSDRLQKIVFDGARIRKVLLDNLISQFGGRIDTIIDLLLEKCPSFVPLNEIYYQKGSECLERLDFHGALQNFKNLSLGLEKVVERFNASRFYVGSAVIVRKMGRCSFEEMIRILEKSIRCRGALSIALEDFREEFSFCLFEALLNNMNDEDYMREGCECCKVKGKPFLRSEILCLSSPFLEPFLARKLEISLKESEYTLLWKYYVLKDMKGEAEASLVRIAENKPMRIDRRIEYLNIAFSISSSRHLAIRVETAKIQRELLTRKYIPVLDNLLLSPSDLLNDYILPNNCFDLGLRLVDLFEYCDVSLLRKLWSDALRGDINEDMRFIKSLDIRRSALDLEILGDILLAKAGPGSPNLINFFVEYGIPKNKVLGFFEKMVKDPKVSHPLQKKKILEILVQSDEGCGEHVKSIAGYCKNNYGII